MPQPRTARLARPATLLAAAAFASAACAPDDAPDRGTVGTADRPAAAPRRSTLRIDPNLGYAQGSADAPVTVYEFSDFGCAYCATFHVTTFEEIRREFIDGGQVRWVFVPFVVGMFRHAEEAARAGECAAEQHAFEPMKARLYAGQRDWRRGRQPLEHFARYAAHAALDTARFRACYEEDRGRERTLLNNRTAQILGVRATPTFIIEGRLIEGALPLDRFRALLQAPPAPP